MKLVLPAVKYKDSFIEAVREFQTEKTDVKFYKDLNIEELSKNFSDFVKKLLSQSKDENLPEGYVPATIFWLIENNNYIGRVSIRHILTEQLLNEGGHIGYDIRPSRRRMGYGKKILKLALPKAKEIGIDNVLVTCDETNMGSKKIIEANGGVFENKLKLHKGKSAKLRYWINIK